MKMAIESVIDEKCHINRDRLIVSDFAQNVPLTRFGAEQPVEIYYLSSLTINLFGMIDLSIAPNKLTWSTMIQPPGKAATMQRQ
jgi:hypothetical protein